MPPRARCGGRSTPSTATDLWGNPGGQLRRRRLVPAVDRSRAAGRLLGRRQPGPVPRHAGVPQRIEPARAEPLHRLRRRARPRYRHAPLVPPGVPPRPVRPRPRPHPDRVQPPTAATSVVSDGQGRHRGRPRPRDGGAAMGRPRSAGTTTTTSPSSPGRPRSCPAPTAASSPRRRTPTASCTSRCSTRRRCWIPTTRRTSAPRWASPTATSVAIDATTGAVRWATKVPGDPLGGATVVNDLVFTALLDGSSSRSTASRRDRLARHRAGGRQRVDGGRRRPPRGARGQRRSAPRGRLPPAVVVPRRRGPADGGRGAHP